VIWSNDSFNGPFRADGFGIDYGNVDIFVPKGCEVNEFEGEFLAPVSGYVTRYVFGEGEYDFGFNLNLPKRVLLEGIEKAFNFSGVEDFDTDKVEHIFLSFGHVDSIEGEVSKGQSLGEIIPCCNHEKVGYQITVHYAGKDYMFTPTLFTIDGPPWPCVVNSPFDCEPEPHDYAP